MPVPPIRRPTLPAKAALPTPLPKLPAPKAPFKAAKPSKPLSNKEIAVVLFVSLAESSVPLVTDEQLAICSGVPTLRGDRPSKIREVYKQLVERYCSSANKLLVKRNLRGRVTTLPQE